MDRKKKLDAYHLLQQAMQVAEGVITIDYLGIIQLGTKHMLEVADKNRWQLSYIGVSWVTMSVEVDGLKFQVVQSDREHLDMFHSGKSCTCEVQRMRDA